MASASGERTVMVETFSPGFRQTVLQPGELVTAITVPKLTGTQRGIYRKLGLRRAQAISVIHLAIVLDLDGDLVRSSRIAYGCLAPTVVRGSQTEAFLTGKRLAAESCAEAGRIARRDVSPIDDIRGTAGYRLATLERLVADSLSRLAKGTESEGLPDSPVLLRGRSHTTNSVDGHSELARNLPPVAPPYGSTKPETGIRTTVNSKPITWPVEAMRKTLLDALREDSRLTGAKEGCAEGECGACTVWLDGQAVMACLVPAAQANGATVTTIEGLASGEGMLHPLQQAFIDQAAVQCGYCIPGMLMAGAMLLDERPEPDTAAIQSALSGNLCRCTGYRKIFAAMRQAATDPVP
jgi:carbon-monoxide dehydrogenase medium subunit